MIRLKEILKQKQMTMACLSDKCGIAASNLCNYANGKTSPTVDTLLKIANALDVDASELIKEKQKVMLFVKINGIDIEITEDDIISMVNNKGK